MRRHHTARLRRAVLQSLEVRRLLAAAIIVNTTIDENDANTTTSLREAIFIAEGTAGSDLINFDPTVFPFGSVTTIPLVSELFTNDNTGKITIDAESGANRVKVSAGGLDRVFEIQTNADVELKGLIIADGFDDFVGGGIYNNGTLLLDEVTVRDSQVIGVPGVDGDDVTPAVVGGDAFGGGVFNDRDGTLTVRDSFFTTNKTTGGDGGNALAGNSRGGNAYGAAIYSLGDLTMDTNDIAFNEAHGGNGGSLAGANGASGGFAQGGGIYAGLDAVVSLRNTTFTLNVAEGGNGGAGDGMHSGGHGGNAAGGAIYSLSDDFTVVATQPAIQFPFNSSRANGGEGGDADDPGIGGAAEGGAIFNGGTMSVTGAGFGTDQARGGISPEIGGAAAGGAIQNTGTLLLDDVTINEARAAGGFAGGVGGFAFGGAISNSASLTIQDSTLTLCVAAGGLALPNTPGGGASAFGGAVYSTDDFLLTRSTISGNSASGGAGGDANFGPPRAGGNGGSALGGGLYLGSAGGSTPTMTDSTLSGNTASGGNGGRGSDGADGGVTGDAGGAGGLGGLASGGAIYLATAADIDNSTLYGNTAAGGDGGAGGNGGDGTLLGGAGGAGGAGALGRGAGIFMDNTQLDAVNTTISFNTAQGGRGGNGGNGGLGDLLGGSGGAGGNGADSVAGGIFITDVLNLTNTIVSNNTVDTGPDLNGPVTLINSLVSTPAGDYTVLAGSADNLLNTPADLGPLQDNGGPTKTAAPDSFTSAAINAGNNAAATAAGLTFDQRGTGFARISQGVVDIGAVELQAPVLTLIGNGRTIPEDDLTPSSLDFTDFGTARLGTPIDRTFTIRNDGGATLNLGFIILPFGFEVLSPFAPTVAPGNSTNFTVRFNPGLPGSFGGNVQISNNTTQNARFDFTVAGTANGSSFRVNFQPASSEVPSGYLADFGSVFGNRGNGYSYGFNQSIASATRDRNAVADQAFDTLVHTQKYGTRTWDVSVPNGMYQVHLVVGDASFFDGIYKVNVEGVLTASGTPSSAKRFFEGTKTVNVTDGKLTISNAAGATNNKLDFVEITPVVPPPPPPIKINFQPSGAPLPSGFLKDSGALFGNRGNGQSYGWNSSAGTFARDRNVLSDQARDTLIHTQLFGTRIWELAVPNGSYSVHLVAGDPSFFDSVYKYNVEGTLTINGTPTSGNRFVEGTKTVVVSDGKLTVTNAAGSVNNKIDFIEVTPL